MKSPKPNKGHRLEAVRRQLMVHAITAEHPEMTRAFFAGAYNPRGVSKAQYKHGLSNRYMDMKHGVLIGREFWDLIGGDGMYEAILDAYREIGREKWPALPEKLALGY